MSDKQTEKPDVIETPPVEQPIENVSVAVRTYFFPNDGNGFSCEAASLEEATKLNEQHQKGTAQPA